MAYQFPEKLIPSQLQMRFWAGKYQYGDGKQIRDWIYVDDHVDTLFSVMENGK